jgi:hypothetical protein
MDRPRIYRLAQCALTLARRKGLVLSLIEGTRPPQSFCRKGIPMPGIRVLLRRIGMRGLQLFCRQGILMPGIPYARRPMPWPAA